MLHVQNNVFGICLMMAGIFFLTAMDALAKLLVNEGMDPLQIIAIRSYFVVAMIVVYCVCRDQLGKLKTSRPWQHAIRGTIGLLAPYCFFKSLESLPLADATVIFFSSTFMITALSWPLLKEKVGWHRWSAVILGFIGVLLAMQPNGSGELVSYLFCLIGSFIYALLFIGGRWLSKTESVISLVFSFNLMLAITSAVFLPLIWVAVTVNIILVMFAFSLLALAGHYCLTYAFSLAPVGVIAPFEYTGLVWATLLGFFIWQDVPDSNVILGAGIIIICGIYVIYRERLAHNESGRPKAEAKIGEQV